MNKKTKRITKKMGFRELIEKHPDVIEILFEKGMHCIGCPMAAEETIEQGAIAHGINPDELVKELNKKVSKMKENKK
jgi:hybrid cluster-associated redox disulfide protein